MGASPSSPASDAAKEDELADLIHRFIDSLADYSDRLPFSLDRQKLRSYTTLAAVAITLIFAWKLLRSPPQEPHRRPHRRAVPSSSNPSSTVTSSNPITSSEICSSSTEDQTQDVINHFFQPVNLTLEQIVRHKLNDGRKVTCRLLGVILEETTPEELQNKVTVRSTAPEILHEIAKFCDVYLMEHILDDQTEERVVSALSEAGVFTSGGLIKEKILFSSTENGRMSFVRQLEPDWHIDSSSEIIHQLSRFIKYELHISPQRTERMSSNVYSSSSLEQFFGGLDQR
ncbi:hypothetical protein LUZ60_009116 [Juncus effusus]|nr:hypothetical protein LUZ60_009116 [Juncus effusus]